MSSTSSMVAEDHHNPSATGALPKRISLSKWEDTGFEWSGAIDPSEFERLSQVMTTEHERPQLNVSARLYQRSHVLHLEFKVVGTVWLTCQRCLQPVAIDVTDEYDMALLEDESQERIIDEAQDYVLLEEIFTEQSPERWLPLNKLIEDEILLKAPLSPKHEDCDMVTSQVGDIPEEENDNPFAALASLKGKL